MATDGAVCWRGIVESANDALRTTHEAGTITFGNARAAALFGLEQERELQLAELTTRVSPAGVERKRARARPRTG